MDADSEDEEEGEEEAEGEEEEDLGPPVNTSLALFAKAPPKYPSAADCKKSARPAQPTTRTPDGRRQQSCC